MRVLRTILGMLLLTIGLPSLLAGAVLWAAIQHRDQGGAFSGELQRLTTPGYALVVPDVDKLLRSDAPFTRIGDTQLRITVRSQDGPAFLGIAPAAAVDEYLYGVPHSTVESVDIGTGTLPVAATALAGPQAPSEIPEDAPFWLRAGEGALAWSPGEVTGGPYSLVVMSPDAKPGLQLSTTAEVRPGWLDSSAWGLLTLGTLLVVGGLVVLAWPARRREIVYVVEPSQVPDLMAAIGAPLPLGSAGARRPAGELRPRTLAEAQRAGALSSPALKLAWPPAGSPALTGPKVLPMRAAPSAADCVAATALPGAQVISGPQVIPGAQVISGPQVVPGPQVMSGPQVVPGPQVIPGRLADAGSDSSPAEVGAGAGTRAARPPAPGEPLSFIRPSSAGGPVSLPLGDPPSAPDPRYGRRTERGRSTPTPGDLPMFHASAVDAWVAETAAERARETEAAAATRLAEAARKKASTDEEPPSPELLSPESPQRGPKPGPGGDRPRPGGARSGPDGVRSGSSVLASAGRDPHMAAQRVSVITGPKATDWAAVGLTRADSHRVGRQPSPGVGQAPPSRIPAPAAEPHAAKARPAEAKPGEIRPAEVKAAEVKPAEVKAAEVKAAEVKAAETKPVEAKVVPSRPRAAVSSAADVTSPKAAPPSSPIRAAGERPNPFPKVFGLGQPAVAAAERTSGDAELGRAVGDSGPAAVTVQREEFSATAEGMSPLRPATPGAPAVSSNSATTASAGAEPPLTASGVRQAAGADTGTGQHDRSPVSAPKLSSNVAATDGPARPAAMPDAGRRPLPRPSAVPPSAPAPTRAAAPTQPSGQNRVVASPVRASADSAAAVATPARAPADSAAAVASPARVPADSAAAVGKTEQTPGVPMREAASTVAPAAVPPTANGHAPVDPSLTHDARTDATAETRLTQRPKPAPGGLRNEAEPRESIGVSGRLPGLGGRPTPAAWRRAAESVAARAAATPEPQSSPAADLIDEAAETEVQPAKTTRARATKMTAAKKATPSAAKSATPTKAASPGIAKAVSAGTAKAASPGIAKAASVGPAKAPATKTTPAKAATTAKPSAADKVAADKIAADKAAPARSASATAATAATAADARPASAAKATPPAMGLMSAYQKEAAELFAASAQRRRRRTVTNPATIEPAPPEPVRRRRSAPTRPEDD